jgi:hypothetical protein
MNPAKIKVRRSGMLMISKVAAVKNNTLMVMVNQTTKMENTR